MENYSIYFLTEKEKYDYMAYVRSVGAKITDVAGCGPGYHICIQATPSQAASINKWLGATA